LNPNPPSQRGSYHHPLSYNRNQAFGQTQGYCGLVGYQQNGYHPNYQQNQPSYQNFMDRYRPNQQDVGNGYDYQPNYYQPNYAHYPVVEPSGPSFVTRGEVNQAMRGRRGVGSVYYRNEFNSWSG